jgi:probable rRNA maturation factor
MSTVFTLEERIPLLLVHGMLHLVGYDHENDKDWKEMTTKEEEVIAVLKSKLDDLKARKGNKK